MSNSPFPQFPSLQISKDVYADKYLQEGESFQEGMYRLAGALSDNEEHRKRLKDIFLSRRFLAAGRVQAAIGAVRQTTPYNCFVSGTIEDSMSSIMASAVAASETMRMGGGIGYNFSNIRPQGAFIKSLHSQASGPVSFMEIHNSVCGVISSAGHRRGAQMGVLNVDHPDIMRFIHAKNDNTTLTNFNVSVGVTDKFMSAVKEGKGFDLTFEGSVYETVDAGALWESIMRMTWDYAEPGVLFLDTINRKNNLWYCEQIDATNPCGEQPLPPHGACLLGSFNLVAYLIGDSSTGYSLNVPQLEADVSDVVRAMDNIIDLALYPHVEQEEEAKNKRRMGLGVTGVANAIEALGPEYRYGNPRFLSVLDHLLGRVRETAYSTSIDLAEEKGSFPMLDREQFLMSGYMKSMPDYIHDSLRKKGIRNSHLTSIAPTGTISLAAENVSSGLEPVFEYEMDRVVRRKGNEKQTYKGLKDFGHSVLKVDGKTSSEVTAKEHVGVLVAASKMVDSACSKTCTVGDDVSWSDFQQIYQQAYEGGASGCTTFRPSGKRFGVISKTTSTDTSTGTRSSEEGISGVCEINPITGEKSCSD